MQGRVGSAVGVLGEGQGGELSAEGGLSREVLGTDQTLAAGEELPRQPGR